MSHRFISSFARTLELKAVIRPRACFGSQMSRSYHCLSSPKISNKIYQHHQTKQHVWPVVTLSRWLSGRTPPSVDITSASSNTYNVTHLPDGFLPEPPDLSSLPESLNALGEPTLASLGLCNYSPAGLVQNLLEVIHVHVDLPWFASIMCLTLIIRTMALPLTIMQLRNAANFHNHMPTITELQKRQVAAAQAGDAGEVQKAGKDAMDYMTRNKVNPLSMIGRSMLMAPIFLSVFYGIRGMAYLPVESLTTGGALWFMDLTAHDPLFLLPFMSASTIYYVTKTGSEGVALDSAPRNMQTMFKILPVFVFVFTSFQPAALALYWTTSNIISVVFSKIFNTPVSRRIFNIPEKINHPERAKPSPGQVESFSKQFNDYQNSVRLAHEIADRKRVDALRYGQADASKGWEEKKSKFVNIGGPKLSDGEPKLSDGEPKLSDGEPRLSDGSKSYAKEITPRLSKDEFKKNPSKPPDEGTS